MCLSLVRQKNIGCSIDNDIRFKSRLEAKFLKIISGDLSKEKDSG